jgi:hypothetical protein
MRLPQSEDPYYTPGFPLSLPLEHASRIQCLDCQPTAKFTDEVTNPIQSDTGELAWWNSEQKGGLVSIDTARTSALVGFVKQNGITTSHLAADIENDFCALTLSSLDGEPLVRSATMLLTTGGKVENSGAVWNARRTNSEVWGDAPTRIEPIKGWILLRQLDGVVGVTITPLDGAARPLGKIQGRMLEYGWEFPIGDIPATSYLIRITH